jgi:hypothetical protein
MTAAAPIEFKRFEKAGRIARFFNAAEKAGYIHQLVVKNGPQRGCRKR